jgi:hypothetical protein
MTSRTGGDMISLPSPEGIIKDGYSEEEINTLWSEGKAHLSPYNTHLNDRYSRKGFSIEERVIVENGNLLPWLASKTFCGIDQRIKPAIYGAIEQIREKTNGTVFGNSPSSGDLIVTALAKGDDVLSEEDLGYLKELEAIAVAQVNMLRLKNEV